MQQGPGRSSPCVHTEHPFQEAQVSSDACEQCADNAGHQQCSHMFADLTLAILPQRISSSFSGPGEDCVADHCAAAASEAPAAISPRLGARSCMLMISCPQSPVLTDASFMAANNLSRLS